MDISRELSMINFPSEGIFYPQKEKSLMVRYLSEKEEHILCDPFLMESGRGIEIVLNSLIVDDFKAKDLLIGDFQAILIFLRSTAYGDNVEVSATCPNCDREGSYFFKLSGLDFKKPEIQPNKEGKYNIFFEELNLNITICPLTLGIEIEKKQKETDKDFFFVKTDEGETIKVKKTKLLSLVYNIESINGISDKEKIKNFIKSLPKKHFDLINDFVEKNNVRVDDNIKFNCSYCQEEFFQKVSIGYDFLFLPDSYKKGIYEEAFMLTYYGKNVSRKDVLEMSVVQRKWFIERIRNEMDKQNDAERNAINKAKGSKGKF